MRMLIGLICYSLIAVFGIVLAAEFSGVNDSKNNFIKLALFSLSILIMQYLCYLLLGLDAAFRLYPLITHLPLILFLILTFHVPVLTSCISVSYAYLCCQLPRWAADMVYSFSHDNLWRHVIHIIVLCIVYILLHRYATKPVQKLLCRSWKSTLVLGVIPLFYYIFDYSTTIYTNLLYSGNFFAVQFMPSLMAGAYFIFLLIYQSNLEERERSRQERDMLELQLCLSEAEFDAMQQLQEQTRQYRHDMRHHVSLLIGFAEAGEYQKAKDYLYALRKDLDAFTPKHFCGNKAADLLLSYFTERAEKTGVTLSVDAKLPASLPFKDMELCSLLSNGLENAVLAASKIPASEDRTVSVRLCIRQQNLLLSIRNPYIGEVVIENGMPVTSCKGHGFGIKSIVSIVNSYGGQVSFTTDNHVFLMRVMLPMKE